MGTFSTRMVATANRLLTKFGQSITFTQTTVGTFNPLTNTTSAATTANYTGFAHPSEYTKFERDLESVRQDDIKLLVEQTTSVPNIGDIFTLDSKVYEVIQVDRIKAQGDTIIYKLQARI